MWNILIFVGLAAVISTAAMPIIIRICQKLKLYDTHDARKIHSGDIPRLGGVGIALAFFVSVLLYLHFQTSIELTGTLPILIAALIIFVFGILDDIFQLPAIVKLLVQLVASAIVTIAGFRFHQIFAWQLPLAVSFILTFFWIVGVINAYNLIDGLDGLCGSLSITAAITLGVLYALIGNPESGVCFILAGAILGFLIFNWPPAKLFMGDAGSQFLGFMIATIPLYTTGDKIFEFNKFLIMIILTSFPVFDTIAAIWRRLRDKKPVMSPDKSHLHHKLLNLGYKKTSSLYLIVLIQILLCLTVILSSFIGAYRGMVILFEALIFMVIFFSVIHYTNRAFLRKQVNERRAAEKEKDSEQPPVQP